MGDRRPHSLSHPILYVPPHRYTHPSHPHRYTSPVTLTQVHTPHTGTHSSAILTQVHTPQSHSHRCTQVHTSSHTHRGTYWYTPVTFTQVHETPSHPHRCTPRRIPRCTGRDAKHSPADPGKMWNPETPPPTIPRAHRSLLSLKGPEGRRGGMRGGDVRQKQRPSTSHQLQRGEGLTCSPCLGPPPGWLRACGRPTEGASAIPVSYRLLGALRTLLGKQT